MRKYAGWFLFLILAIGVAACRGGVAPTGEPSQGDSAVTCGNADLTIVSGSNAETFLDGNDGLLSQFKAKTGLTVCVQPMSGPEAVNLKASLLSKSPADFVAGDPAAFIFDSNMFADGLNDQTYIGNSLVGIWIRESTVNKLNLSKGTPLSMEKYASMMENGELKIVTAPAYSSTPASIMFFQTFSSFYGPNNQLSPEQVRDQAAIDYGKRVYDHYVRSATSTTAALDMVRNDSNGMYDGVVGFESSFLGKEGRNAGLSDPFIFFYFDPSVISTITLGRLQLDGKNLENYKAFADFLTSEEAQIYIAGTGIRPQKDVVDLSTDLFKSEWGLSISPAVTYAFTPTYSVASLALDTYRDYYKRAKVVTVVVDVSPSTFQNSMMTSVGGTEQQVLRIQAMDIALKKINDANWLEQNHILPGKNDVFDYYFFSTMRSDLVVQTTGTQTTYPVTTDPNNPVLAANVFEHFLGPETGGWDSNAFNTKTTSELNGFYSNGTAMFNASRDMLAMIENSFDPNVDYYIVILTDGEDGGDFSFDDFYDMWNASPAKSNVTLIGIAFGTEGKSISVDNTAKFGGNTYFGNNDAQLVDAFKQIIKR